MDTWAAFAELPAKIDALTAEVAALRARLDDLSPSGGEFLSVAEAARLLGVSERKVRKDVTAGEIPSVKRGARRLIPRKKLLASMGCD